MGSGSSKGSNVPSDEYRSLLYAGQLVMEQSTIWPEEYDELEWAEKQRLEQSLHADPQRAVHLEYVRMHTGFCRQITVTPEDMQRLAG
jgi:hypothetical protein